MPIPINISGSRGASILGLSQYKTPQATWLEIMESLYPGFCQKHKYELPVFEGNASTRWGTAFEDAIIKLTEDKLNTKIVDREVLCIHPKYKFITCHPDGCIDGKPGLLYEGKTTTIYSYNSEWGEPGTDRIPLIYQIQVQHNLIVTGLKKAIVSVLVFPKRPDEWEDIGYTVQKMYDDDNHPEQGYIIDNGIQVWGPSRWAQSLAEMGYFHTYEINADNAVQKLMLAHYRKWWKTHVIGKTPPQPVNIDDIKAILKEPIGTIICPESMERWKDEYNSINEEMNIVKKRKEQIKMAFLGWGKMSQTAKNNPIDDDSVNKWVFMNEFGEKLFSYDGKTFRAAGK
jgi:hypothetical protein